MWVKWDALWQHTLQMVICIGFEYFKNHSEDDGFINFYSLLLKCFLGWNTHGFLCCYLTMNMLWLFLQSGFILKAIFFFFGFTVQLSSEWVEYLYISLIICTQAFWFVHPVKHSAENTLEALFSPCTIGELKLIPLQFPRAWSICFV